MIYCIFASLVPPKPLHNAQMWGSFYFMTFIKKIQHIICK